MHMENVLRQAGALPYKMEPDGLRVLLITSRGTGRWVIPKGGIEKGFTPAQAAAQEAYEEAGIRGSIDPVPLGSYTYPKRMNSGRIKPASVLVFGLRFEKQLKTWPEQSERRFAWMTIAGAIAAVRDPGVANLLRRLNEIHAGEKREKAG
jgi:8-oxo-dGTP pyrophosphatase MutT (NUDIX family)